MKDVNKDLAVFVPLLIALLLVSIAVVAECDEPMTVEEMKACVAREPLTAEQVEALGLGNMGTLEYNPADWPTQEELDEFQRQGEMAWDHLNRMPVPDATGIIAQWPQTDDPQAKELDTLRKQVTTLSAEVEILKASFIVYEDIVVYGRIIQASGESTFNHLNIGSGSVSGFFSASVIEARAGASVESLTIRGVDIPSDLPARVEALEAAGKAERGAIRHRQTR